MRRPASSAASRMSALSTCDSPLTVSAQAKHWENSSAPVSTAGQTINPSRLR